MKQTNFTREQKKYLLQNGANIAVEVLAKETERTPKRIATWLKAQGITPIWENKENAGLGAFNEKWAVKEELRASPIWKRLKEKFSEDEIFYVEDRYAAFITQFKEDVMATEENQILKLITYDILMDRNLIQRKSILNDIKFMEKEQNRLVESAEGKIALLGETEAARLEYLQREIVLYREQERSMSKEFTDLEAHHQAIMKALKGTRDQRLDKIESSKETFVGLIRKLQEEEVRNQVGITHALMEKATQKEFARLAKPHKYMDGNEDQPILSAESIDFLEELHKGEDEDD